MFIAEHNVYYYTFGPSEAFRRLCSLHKNGDVSTIVSFKKKASFSKWTRCDSFEYKLVHKWEDERPYVIAPYNITCIKGQTEFVH